MCIKAGEHKLYCSDRENMKKGIYIHSVSSDAFPGVYKKITDQIKCFSYFYDICEYQLESRCVNLAGLIVSNLPFGSYRYDYQSVLQSLEDKKKDGGDFSFVYIRKQPIDRQMLRFIRMVRRLLPESKIILEIPTYPYKMEMLRVPTYIPFYIKDTIYKGQLKKYVDRVVTFTELDYFAQIPVISIKNGIDVSRLCPIKKNNDTDGYILRMIAVATFRPCDGYERIIEGLGIYNKSNHDIDVELHLVGEGQDLEKYKQMAHVLDVEDKVFFYGKRQGEELNMIYNNASIGLGFFGAYKDGLKVSSALKIREYLAKGLPVVSAIEEDAFDNKQTDIYLKFDNDNSIVDIDSVVSFYSKLIDKYGGRENLANRIHNYAKDNVDMSVTMTPVIEYINQ